jgi:hypothetical protein
MFVKTVQVVHETHSGNPELSQVIYNDIQDVPLLEDACYFCSENGQDWHPLKGVCAWDEGTWEFYNPVFSKKSWFYQLDAERL